MIEEPRLSVTGEYEEASNEEKIDKVFLETGVTIGNLEVEEKKFSFKMSRRTKALHSILWIPVHT